ncbi:MAG: glycosyl hydrolase family 28 protein, partial [Kiritimatiellae bacterium]|nr:glycosyl hydrolase family 28 protein [Kiritimatiellia bacterium]
PENRIKEPERHPYSFAVLESAGEATVEIESSSLPLDRAEILPVSKGVKAAIREKSRLVFKAKPPFKLVVEPTGRHDALFLAGYLPEANPPKAGDPGVVYFGPGRHRPETISLASNQTLYLAAGAWVEAAVCGIGTNVAVRGRGVLSGAPWPWTKGPRFPHKVNKSGCMLNLQGRDLTVRDVTLHSSWCWTLVLNAATNALIDGVNVVGGRVINDDGIDVCRAKDVEIRNSFVRCQDDCITPKWHCENLVATNCVLWTDVANAIRIGYECSRPPLTYKNLLFKDLDVLHLTLEPSKPEDYWANCAICIQPVNEQTLEDFTFEDVRFHSVNPWDVFLLVKTMPTTTFNAFPDPGYAKNMTFRNVSIPYAHGGMCAAFFAHDDRHFIDGVTFDNVRGCGPIRKKGAVRNVPSTPAPRFVNVLPSFAEAPDFALSEIRRQRRDVGLREFMPSLSFHPQRTPAKALIPELCGRFRKLKADLKDDDVVLGVLIQSILGHGWNGKVPLTDEKWTHMRKLQKDAEDPRYCLLDPGFRAYALDCVASIARERPAFILLDDDFGVRSGECFCDRHVAQFNAALGVEWTRADYRKLYAGEATDDPRVLKVNAVLQRTMTDMAREIRRTIDAVDPAMRCGLCACWPGWWQLDEVVHALAGPNTRPFLRLNGACYGDVKAADLVHQFRGMRRVAAQITGDVELWDEADTFPQNYWSESAAMFHAHLTQAMLMGLDGAKLWTSEFRHPVHTGSQARYEAYLRDFAGFYATLRETIAAGVRWQGVGAPVFRPRPVLGGHALRTPEGVYGDDWSCPLEATFGTPLRYDSVDAGGAFTLRREDVRAMTDDDIAKVLSGKAIVGGKAAQLLCARGFGELLGVKADAGDDAFHFKFETPADGSWLMGCNWCEGMTRLAPVGRGAETTHWFCQGTRVAPERKFPAAVQFKNAKGGTVITLGWDFDLPFHYQFQPLRRAEYLSHLDRLNGKPVEFVAETGDATLVRHGLLADGHELVTLNALTYEVEPSVKLRLLRTPKTAEELSPAGAWRPVSWTRTAPDAVVVAAELKPLVPLVLRFGF